MSKITDLTAELARPVVEACGCTLWDVEYIKEAGSWYLRLYIDKEDGVSIDDCEAVSRGVDPLLDEADPIQQAYILEVSSPGIERELKNRDHVMMCLGDTVEIRLYAVQHGAKVHRGTLVGMTEAGNVQIEQNETLLEFDADKIAKLQTVFDFGAN